MRHHILPPASIRNVAAEAMAAASVYRDMREILPTPTRPARSLAYIVAASHSQYQQLVGEITQEITEGKCAGTTWLKPLALRMATNTSLALAAERYDVTLGWFDAPGSECIVPSSVHVFAPGAPSAFVPSDQLRGVPRSLGLAVRSMSDAHAESAAEGLLLSTPPPVDEASAAAEGAAAAEHAGSEMGAAADMAVLRSFLTLLGEATAAADSSEAGPDA